MEAGGEAEPHEGEERDDGESLRTITTRLRLTLFDIAAERRVTLPPPPPTAGEVRSDVVIFPVRRLLAFVSVREYGGVWRRQ